MEFAVPTGDWLPVRPFWRGLDDDLFVLVHDVPMAPRTEPFHGVEITGWGSHDKLVPPCTHPPYLLEQIRKRFGDSPIQVDEYGQESVGRLRRLHRQLLDLTRSSTDLTSWMLQLPWHLAIVAFGALHRGGHRFWDRSSVAGRIPEHLTSWFDGALRELYVAADTAVGRLVEAAPDASIFVFSLHGMTVNAARVDLLDGMLARLLRGPETLPARKSRLRRVGEAVPLPIRRALTRRVPARLKNRLMTEWTAGGVDWETTRAFTLRADLNGYVRINLKGREARGIVPRDQFDALCDQIRQGLLSFGDAMSGEDIIEEVRLASEAFPPGAALDRLPDLIVRWKETSGAPHIAVESARFGRVPRATPGRIPNGRSGNHRGVGFLIARGPGIAAGGRLQPDADVLDLAPTVVRRVGARSSTPFAGRVLEQLA
jgi:predicted AlkP superfamily phosphohydrolase/phosphomutase